MRWVEGWSLGVALVGHRGWREGWAECRSTVILTLTSSPTVLLVLDLHWGRGWRWNRLVNGIRGLVNGSQGSCCIPATAAPPMHLGSTSLSHQTASWSLQSTAMLWPAKAEQWRWRQWRATSSRASPAAVHQSNSHQIRRFWKASDKNDLFTSPIARNVS